ncbi:DoxX family membrane protein [Ferruginibacter lapsinanis]|uniref:BT_3928 family protein n=1 Tax=Ferruginibacter lapsinanis TaxID=563172 RepID=UPI001E3CA0F7|nr:BT_3928 family protein [Ferruginibacter lapsinanis]UEG49399.1 DoxX family membrane protein [Ferruginibacter lapsinanis]
MKIAVNIARILVGALFIFSGLVKAIDPLGLSYKMQEFFEAWAADKYLPSMMHWFHGHSYLFSIVMITLEVVLGVALLVGWRKKWTLSLLLLLIIFFTFLTSYVLFSGKIRACGCFGDCIPLTPVQTFTKDIILLVLALFLIIKQKLITPIVDNIIPFATVLIATIGVLWLQMYVTKHLPIKDCLPYKVGNDILKLRKMPDGAIPDKYDYVFVYKKGAEQKDFTADKLPDSTWEFVDRKQTLVEKGKNNIPLINDFSLTDSSGTDVTEAVLGQPGEYYLFFIKNFDEPTTKWTTGFTNLWENAKASNKPIYIITADTKRANAFFNEQNKYEVPVYSCDATAIKTAARATPTVFVMKSAVVQHKYSWADIDKAIKH